jgi:hypothetical protein
MKRVILIALWAFAGLGFLYLSNCSRPLDIDRIVNSPPDTVFVSDTVIFNDTLFTDTTIIDTVIIDTTIIDTVYVDTTFIDTVYIDSMYCARLSSHRQEVVWILFNQPGTYQLDFLAITERIRRSQTLTVDIDGTTYSWRPGIDFEFSVEQTIGQYAIIRVSSEAPHAYGQAIDICLNIKEPE